MRVTLFFFSFAAFIVLTVMPLMDARAGERISIHEINQFVDNMNNTLNSSDSMVGRNFMRMNVSEKASFEITFQNVWTNPDLDYRLWYNDPVHPMYYRYPYSYAPYYRPVSLQSMNKWEMIGNFEGKKRLVAGYSQEMIITSINMPADAGSAVVKVSLKEFGLRYLPHRTDPTEKVQHADSKCKLHFRKNSNRLNLTLMTCNTVSYLPV